MKLGKQATGILQTRRLLQRDTVAFINKVLLIVSIENLVSNLYQKKVVPCCDLGGLGVCAHDGFRLPAAVLGSGFSVGKCFSFSNMSTSLGLQWINAKCFFCPQFFLFNLCRRPASVSSLAMNNLHSFETTEYINYIQ